jgi:hypothetical protein
VADYIADPQRRSPPIAPRREVREVIVTGVCGGFVPGVSHAGRHFYFSATIIAVVNGLGTGLNTKFKSISTQLK